MILEYLMDGNQKCVEDLLPALYDDLMGVTKILLVSRNN